MLFVLDFPLVSPVTLELSYVPNCTVSEIKVLCHPSCVDSLSTSAATKNHVSMAGQSARKALRVVEQGEESLLFTDKHCSPDRCGTSADADHHYYL